MMKKEPKCSVCPDDVKSIPKNLKKYQVGTRTYSDPREYEIAARKYKDSLDLYTYNNNRLQNLLKLNKQAGATNKLERSQPIPKSVYESASTISIDGKYKKQGEDFESLEQHDIDPIDSWKLTELYDKYNAPSFIKKMGLFDSKEEGFVDYGLVYKKPVQLPIFKKAEEKKQQPAVKPTPPAAQEKKVEVVNPLVVVKKFDTKGNLVEQDTVSPTSVNKRFDSATKTWKQKLQLGGDLEKYQVGTPTRKKVAELKTAKGETPDLNPLHWKRNISKMSTDAGYETSLKDFAKAAIFKGEGGQGHPETNAFAKYLGEKQVGSRRFEKSPYKENTFQLHNYEKEFPDDLSKLSEEDFKAMGHYSNTHNNVLKPFSDYVFGRHTVNKVPVENGGFYLEYNDRWDLNPERFVKQALGIDKPFNTSSGRSNVRNPEVESPGVISKALDFLGDKVERALFNPFDIYGRIYYDSQGKKLTGPQKSLYQGNNNSSPVTSFKYGGEALPKDLKKYQVGTNFLKESASPPKIPKELQRFDVKPKGTSGVIKKDIGPEATYNKVVDGVKARFNDKTPDSLSENLSEFVDPSGILSYDDAGKAYSKWGKENSFLPTGEEALDMFGAVPMLGKFSKLKYLVEGKGLMKSAYKYFPWQKAVNTADGSQDVYSDNLKVEGTESSVKRRKTIEENTSKFKTPLSKYQLGTSTYVAPPMPLNLKKMVEEDELAKRISSNEAAAVKMAPLAYKGPVPKLDKVDYRHTNIQSKNYSGNPNLAFTAPGKTGETRKLMEENFNAGTMAALEFATPLAATKITKPLTNLLKVQDQYLDVQNLSRLRTELADKGILKSQKTPNFPWKEPIRKGIDPWGYNIAEKIQDVGSLFKNSKNRHYLSPEQMEIAYQEELKYLAQVDPNITYSRADFMSSLPQENFFKTTRENVLDRFNNRFKSYSQIAKNRAASWDMYLGKPQLENPMYDVSELSTKKNTVYTIKPEYIDLPTVENSLNSHIDLIQNQYPKMSPEKTFRILDSDSDYFGTMGGFNWDISKIKGGHYKAIANDKWDLHPFDYGLSDFAPYRKIYNNAGNFGRKVLDGAEKKLKGIEAGKALGIGKPMDVKVGFILDGKTKKIIKTFGAAPLAASNEEINKGDGKGNLPKFQLAGPMPTKQQYQDSIQTNYQPYLEKTGGASPLHPRVENGYNCINGVCNFIKGTNAHKFEGKAYSGNATFNNDREKMATTKPIGKLQDLKLEM